MRFFNPFSVRNPGIEQFGVGFDSHSHLYSIILHATLLECWVRQSLIEWLTKGPEGLIQ